MFGFSPEVMQLSHGFQWEDGSFMSALGGALSLYLGIALAMIFEIIELFIDFFFNLYEHRNVIDQIQAQSRTEI
jgi:hypothetical protein